MVRPWNAHNATSRVPPTLEPVPGLAPQLGIWHRAGIPNWGSGITQVSPTRGACIFLEAWLHVIPFPCGQRSSGSLGATAAAAPAAPVSEAAPAGPRQMRARAWPASFIAGWVHGGACHSGGGAIGLARYLSVSIGSDMSLSVSIGLDWCGLVSIGPSRPRWVSVGPDRSRSASIVFGCSGACPRPVEIDRRRSRPTETG